MNNKELMLTAYKVRRHVLMRYIAPVPHPGARCPSAKYCRFYILKDKNLDTPKTSNGT